MTTFYLVNLKGKILKTIKDNVGRQRKRRVSAGLADEEPRGSRSHPARVKVTFPSVGLVISPALLATCHFHSRFTAHPQHLTKKKNQTSSVTLQRLQQEIGTKRPAASTRQCGEKLELAGAGVN